MGDSPLSLPDLEAAAAKRKKDYWEQLIAANDPDATTKHDAFCAEIDQITRQATASAASLQQIYELTRDVMTNVAIAYDRGDHDEVARLVAEHDELMGR